LSQVDIAAQSARGSFVLLAGNLIQALTGLVFVIVVARLLGTNGYGQYTLALLIPLTIQTVVGSGVSSGITRYAAYHLSRGDVSMARRMTLNGIAFLISIGALLTIVAYAGAEYLDASILHRTDLSGVAEIASIAIFAQTLLQAATAGLLGWRSMGRISIANVVWGVLRLGVAVPLVLLGFSVAGAVLGYIVATLVSGALALFLLYVHLRRVEDGLPRMFLADAKSVLSYSAPLYLGSVVTTAASQYVLIILAVISSNSVVGLYQSASIMLIPVSITSTAIAQTLFPAFAHLEGTKADIGLAFKYAVSYTGFFVAPMIFFLAGAARPLFDVVYPATFSTGAPYLVLLSFASAPLILGFSILPSLFNGVGKTRLSMVFSLAYASLQVVLAPLFAIGLGLGVSGLIYSILLSSLGAVALGLRYSGIALNASIDWPRIGAITLASILSYAAVLLVGTVLLNSVVALLLDLVVFAAVYLTVVPVARGLDGTDLLRLEEVAAGSRPLRTLLNPLLAYERFVRRMILHEPPKVG